MSPPRVPLPIQQLSPKTDDGRYWWPGLPPGTRIPWDIRLMNARGELQHFLECGVDFSHPRGPVALYASLNGGARLPIELKDAHADGVLWFAFPKAHREARWIPLGPTGVRVTALPDVFSLWEARYAIMQLEKLWPVPIRDSSTVNYTEYQPMRRH